MYSVWVYVRYGSFRLRMNAWSTVQVKLWDPLRTRAIPERFRCVFTTRRYTNPRLPLPLPLWSVLCMNALRSFFSNHFHFSIPKENSGVWWPINSSLKWTEKAYCCCKLHSCGQPYSIVSLNAADPLTQLFLSVYERLHSLGQLGTVLRCH